MSNTNLTLAELEKLPPAELYAYLYGNVNVKNLRLEIKNRGFGNKLFPHANVTMKKDGTSNKKDKIFNVRLTKADVSNYFKGEYDKGPFRTIVVTFPPSYLGASSTIKFLKETLTTQLRALCANDRSALKLTAYDPMDEKCPNIADVVNGFIRDNMNDTPGVSGFFASISLENIRDPVTQEDLGYGALKVSSPSGTNIPLKTLETYKAVAVPTKVAFEVKIHNGKANIRAKLYAIKVNDLNLSERDDGSKESLLLMGGEVNSNLDKVLSTLKLDDPVATNRLDLSGLPSASGGTIHKMASPAGELIPQNDATGMRDPTDE